jgi:hypothetical protein
VLPNFTFLSSAFQTRVLDNCLRWREVWRAVDRSRSSINMHIHYYSIVSASTHIHSRTRSVQEMITSPPLHPSCFIYMYQPSASLLLNLYLEVRWLLILGVINSFVIGVCHQIACHIKLHTTYKILPLDLLAQIEHRKHLIPPPLHHLKSRLYWKLNSLNNS